MAKKPKTSPNTYLGDVYFFGDTFFGTYLWMVQEMVGARPSEDRSCVQFRQALKDKDVDALEAFFDENVNENGYIYLELSISTWQSFPVAHIETKFKAENEVDERQFLQLVQDFVEYVYNQPIINPEDRVGSTWTDEDIARGYSEEANKQYQEIMVSLNEAFKRAEEEVLNKKKK